MPVLLRRPDDPPGIAVQSWCAIGSDPARLPAAPRMADLPRALERSIDLCADQWAETARDMRRAGDAVLAHAPSCAGNISDFGLMLAWTRLVGAWAEQSETRLVLCADPWLFRHLAALPGVQAGKAPALAAATLKLSLRGWAARAKAALKCARAAVSRAPNVPAGGPVLLVYGHPSSDGYGADAYFGPLMTLHPQLRRAVHVDCPLDRAAGLNADNRTASLHHYGSPIFALSLIFRRWRPQSRHWLVRRAAAIEGGTGSPAMIAWQIHCQRRFLAATRPSVAAWPWENHGWERALVAACKAQGIRSIGYQHATIGLREWNYAPGDAQTLPDRILTVGRADSDRLAAYGHDPARISIAGALRYPPAPIMPAIDAAAPVFVALPFDPVIAAEMVAAVRSLARPDRRFVIKDHPMSPFLFKPGPGLIAAEAGLSAQPAVSAVLYAMTTVGLEAALAGLPTLRFIPAARPVIDIIPQGMNLPSASAEELEQALAVLTPSPAWDRAAVFADPDYDLWREVLA